MAKLRDYLWYKAKEKPRKLCKGPHKIPSTDALAKELGVAQSTVSRIMRLDRNIVERDEDDLLGKQREQAARELPYNPGPRLVLGLLRFGDFADESEMWDVILNSPPAPLPDLISLDRED